MRKLCLWALTAAAALAQSPPAPSLVSLEQTARQKAADWEKLEQGLNASIRGLLPCDPKALGAINQVSLASEARLAALADYLQAAAQQASRNTEAARRALVSSGALTPGWNEEKTDINQEQAGADGQILNLMQSSKNRASFDPSKDALHQVRTELKQRADQVEAGSKDEESLAPTLRDLATASEARDAAWKDILAANEAERSHWKAYYAARLVRGQTECAIIGGTVPALPAPARPPVKGKQP